MEPQTAAMEPTATPFPIGACDHAPEALSVARQSLASFVAGYLRNRAQWPLAHVTPSPCGLTVRYGPAMGRQVEHFIDTEIEHGGVAPCAGDWLTLFGDGPLPAMPPGLHARWRAAEFFMASCVGKLRHPPGDDTGRFGDPKTDFPTPETAVFRHEADGRTLARACCAMGLDRDVVVDRVATDPAFRGQGMARSLLRAVVDWALARVGERVLLISSLDGHRLYRGLGFDTVASVRVFVVEAAP